MIAYVYKWTHIPTLKWYIGSRTAKGCHPEDGYICSSKIVKPLIINNLNDWKRTIVATGSPKEMLELEFDILDTMDAINDPRSFNMANGPLSGIVGKYKTEEHKEKLRLLNLGKKHTKESIEKMKARRKLQTNNIGGGSWSAAAKQRNKGIPQTRISCIFCKKECIIPTFGRWHLQCAVVSQNSPIA